MELRAESGFPRRDRLAGDGLPARRTAQEPDLKRAWAAAALLAGLAPVSGALAWGERGHHVICEAATRLVKEEGLKKFLLSRGEMMGHLCNIPDIHWRDTSVGSKEGNDSHFINPELLGGDITAMPVKFSEIPPKLRAGSLWWRADQFHRLSSEAAARGDIYRFMVNLGLMGHFVGDAAQPYHNTIDYDGCKTGHGGIHAYYESEAVNAMPLRLPSDLELAAGSAEKIAGASVVERMKRLSTVSVKEIPGIEKLDRQLLLSPPAAVPGKTGGCVAAQRLPASKAAHLFRAPLIREMARAAKLLAELWDELYAKGGRPDLTAYRSRRYPLRPKFVPPDYLTSEESGKNLP